MLHDTIDDPLLMRGSLNASYRKSEMNRINRENAKILKQLSQVGPAVGTYDSWRRHEKRHNHIKNHISGNNQQQRLQNVSDIKPSAGGMIHDRSFSTAPQSQGAFGRIGTSQSNQRNGGRQYKLPQLQG